MTLSCVYKVSRVLTCPANLRVMVMNFPLVIKDGDTLGLGDNFNALLSYVFRNLINREFGD